MKISAGVRNLYDASFPIFRRLADDVDARLRTRVEGKGWFFRGRVKELESFALKLETGRVSDPERAEDFFGCTIIVRTAAEIAAAEALVASHYNIKERRPPVDSVTYKSSSNFIFDDLRLFVEQPASTTGKDLDLDGLPFEVQIKTILQYAWGVATHDLTYKSDSVSWPRERIAFQVKAMLEHAEVAIAEAHSLASAPSLAKCDQSTTDITHIIQVISDSWESDKLPDDRKRLAENVHGLLRLCGAKVERLLPLINAEVERVGLLPTDLSPYAFIVQAMANSDEINLQKSINNDRNRRCIFVHSGMDLPDWMQATHSKIIRVPPNWG